MKDINSQYYEIELYYLGFGNESRCFDELGCFPMENPWISNLRPFPQPMTPEEIDAKIYFFTRYAKIFYRKFDGCEL